MRLSRCQTLGEFPASLPWCHSNPSPSVMAQPLPSLMSRSQHWERTRLPQGLQMGMSESRFQPGH